VKLLIDANLSLRVAHRLAAAGHDVRHVFDVELGTATDEEILDAAAEADRLIVSSDTDFGALLARFDRTRPSFVLLRHGNEITPDAQADLLLTALVDAAAELEAGAAVSVSPAHLRARRLPFGT
jgi:predicted nuclease of predicted toxin-antitoxin system